MKRITIKDVAKDLNLSISTVSRALAGDKSISAATIQRTQEAARRLGYRRNVLAARLRSGTSNTVGVIVSELESTRASDLISGLQQELASRNIHVFIAHSENDPDQELEHINMFEHTMVDGLIISLCDKSRAQTELRRLIKSGLPVVFCDCLSDVDGAAHLVANDFNKAFFLVENIIRSGRKKIVHLKGDSVLAKYETMARAYGEALDKFHLHRGPEMMQKCEISVKGGREAIDYLLDSGIDFDSVFACNDLVAIGAMNRLRERGHRVPEDVSIAGYSGSHLSKIVYPPLTTVETPMKEMGRQAAKILLDRFDDPSKPLPSVTFDSRICLRGSSQIN